ncbi:MAG TPA: lipocalin family protein [Caulobacteraceae bacterium]|nr:lipocalin family protein [Caulobacteraceae bacterium]
MFAIAALMAGALTAAPALAGAPQPAKPVPPTLYAGRWYEIARTPNLGQKDCLGASSQFEGRAPSDLQVLQTCHAGSPNGPAKTFSAKAKIMPASGNAKVRMLFFGGLVSQEYWILDHADDNAWAIMATPGGHYVWVLARRPTLDPAVRAAVLGRVRALGYDLSHLMFPQQMPR